MLGEAHDGVQGAGCSSGEMLGGSAGRDVERSAGRDVERSVGWEAEWKTMRCGVEAGWDGKRQKWRAKSLRTPFYQYSIYNQKDVLIIVLIILSHPLRSGHSHFHLEQ